MLLAIRFRRRRMYRFQCRDFRRVRLGCAIGGRRVRILQCLDRRSMLLSSAADGCRVCSVRSLGLPRSSFFKYLFRFL